MTDCDARLGLHTQLDNGRPTASYDCGVEGTIRSIDYASCGQVILEEPLVRKLMGREGKVATNPPDWKRAIESDEVAERFKNLGLHRPRARLLSGTPIDEALGDLRKGRLVTGAVWYGTLNLLAPHKSGSRTFSDNHCVSVLGLSRGRTKLYDSLDDGRTVAGHRYPKGPVTIPWTVFGRMCADVRIRTRDANGRILTQHRLGAGRFLGITVARAKPFGSTDDPTPPPPSPEDVIARLTQELADAKAAHLADLEEALATALDLVDQLEDAITEVQS